MSFSSEMKKELSKMTPEKKCCILAEIAGFVRMNGSIRLMGGGRMNLSVSSEDPSIARHFKQMMQSYFDTTTSLDIIQETSFRKGKTYRITFDDANTGGQVLRETGLMTVQEGSNVLVEGITQEVVRKKCCKRAYLRGLFLAGGSVSDPEKGYHMEIICKNESIGADVKRLMNHFGLNAKVTPRRDQYVVYLKDSEHIIDFMNIIGAHSQLLEFENIRIIKGMRNQANRIVNCENANLDKTVNAAGRQIDDIRFVENRIGIRNLPEKLRVVAELRLEHPDVSLKELAAMVEPPISKSGANHRLARVSELAARLREEEPNGSGAITANVRSDDMQESRSADLQTETPIRGKKKSGRPKTSSVSDGRGGGRG